MKIAIKTSGILDRYLPAGAKDGAATLEIGPGATVADLITQLGIPGDEEYMILVNDSVVRKPERAGRGLSDGDRVSIVPPLKGG